MKKSIAIIVLFTLFAPTLLAQGQKTPTKPTPRPGDQQKNKPLTPSSQKPVDKPEEIQTGDEIVKLGADLVNLFFSAVDQNNRIVSNIKQDEVTILEDGKPQPLFAFKRESTLPINIAILMDLSGSQEYTFPKEKTAASEFLRSILRQGK